MILFRDSLNLYKTWSVTKKLPDQPSKLPAGAPVAKVTTGDLRDRILRKYPQLTDRTVTAVTLTYQLGPAIRLQEVEIGRPQRFRLEGRTWNEVGWPDADTVHLGSFSGSHVPRTFRLRRDPAHVLLTLTPGMTEADVVALIKGTDPGQHASIAFVLENLLMLVRRHWLKDLSNDVRVPCRPMLTLDRDREVMPVPDTAQVARDREGIVADIAAIGRLSPSVANAIAINEAMVGNRGTVRQQTAWSADLLGQAVTDAPSWRNWNEDDQARRPVHRRPGNPGQVSLVNGVGPPDHALAPMREASLETGSQGIPLLHTLLTLARDASGSANGGVVTMDLDELAMRLFGRSRGPVEAAQRRATLWEQVRFIANLRVEGPGPRVKIRQGTGWVDMAWFHPLIVIEGLLTGATGPVTPEGLHQAPAVIEFRASDRFARDATLGNRALPVLGVLKRVIEVPSGTPSGSWAKAIVFALLFEARKRSCATVEVSRRYLLTHYPGNPHPEDMTDDPRTSRRAVEYWHRAIETIKRDVGGLIETIEDPEAPTGRGWAARWLKQTIVIRLGLDVPETAGLRKLIDLRAQQATIAANRRDRETIRADTIRRRNSRPVPPA